MFRERWGNFLASLRRQGLFASLSGGVDPEDPRSIAFLRHLQRERERHASLAVPLTQLEVAVFDLETTGFRPQEGDEIIAIGAVRFTGLGSGGEETFYTLVNPGREIPEPISRLTGITGDSLRSAPRIEEAILEFLRFVGKRILIAHYSRHDRRFLEEALWKTCRARLRHRVIDTRFLYQALYPGLADYSLEGLLTRFNLEVKRRHHALDDAHMAAALWKKGLREALDQGLETLEDLYHRMGSSA